MKKFAIISLLLLTACGVTHHLPPESEHTIVHYIDSIAWHDSTIIHYLTKERYVDITKPLDTLNLETSYAKAEAYLDTSMNVLRGSIENKDVPIETVIKWKEKIVYKDSIQVKEIPYPVEVPKEVTKYPKTYWWLLAFSILSAAYFGVKTYLKFKLA
jgi:hypothetical protein